MEISWLNVLEEGGDWEGIEGENDGIGGWDEEDDVDWQDDRDYFRWGVGWKK